MKIINQMAGYIVQTTRRGIFFLVLILFRQLTLNAQLDFKYDSILYKTMYPHYFTEFLNNHPETIVLDVRSPGEFSDTSMYRSLNFGHLRVAMNIPKDSIQKSLPKLEKYKNTPVIVYCSHSQRSRRACKQLSENGFTQVINLNGGMSWMSQAKESEFPGKGDLVISSLPYKILSVYDATNLIKENKELFILDVRTKDEYENRDTTDALNLGRIKGAINIPFDILKKDLTQMMPYKNRTILIYDYNGVINHTVARLLLDNGFSRLNILNGGISSFYEKTDRISRKEVLENLTAYQILSPLESIDLLFKNKNLVILDLRPADEYNNLAKETWRNRGIIKYSINIPPDKFLDQITALNKSKTSEILVYGNGDQAKNCRILIDHGYKNVNLLYGGIFSLIYVYANVEGYRNVKSLLANYEGLY
jgi:rhodanese-related sulfurtransferase